MDDGSSNKSTVSKLKNEWALFWESIAGEDIEDEKTLRAKAEDAFHSGKLEVLGVEQLHQMSKALSEDRKHLNQKLENLNKELDLNSAKLETLRLVGSNEEDTLKRINELHDIGQSLGNQLVKIDEKLRWTRSKQQELQLQEMEG